MKSSTWITLLGLFALPAAQANDSFNAELSHFVGNAALASATTVVVDKYYPKIEKPARTGFFVSTSEVILGECFDYAKGGQFSILDVVVGTFGSAAGAYATDKWYIAPKANTAKGESTYGVVVSRRF